MSKLRKVLLEIKLSEIGFWFGVLLYSAVILLGSFPDIYILFILGGIFLILTRPHNNI